jgi:hypothetical protein
MSRKTKAKKERNISRHGSPKHRWKHNTMNVKWREKNAGEVLGVSARISCKIRYTLSHICTVAT